MQKIESFKINHLNLNAGLYVSRRDRCGDCTVTTFDLRITAPNREPVIDMPALHTIEHLCATFLRNSKQKENVVYFGPMGCRTGCYLVMFGELNACDVYDLSASRAIYRAPRPPNAEIIPNKTLIWQNIILKNTKQSLFKISALNMNKNLQPQPS